MASTLTSTTVGGNLWIVADIGGTYARLGLCTPEGGLVREQIRRYRNDEFRDPAELLRAYRNATGQSPASALLAVALPLERTGLRMTNRPWSFSAQQLRTTLGLRCLRLVNDFAAAAAGTLTLTPREQIRICGSGAGTGPRLVVGPGTGLGAAVVLSGEHRPQILPSEAGHMGAAATDPLACRVLARIQRSTGRVSWERLLSGSGLAMFDAVVRDVCEPAEAAVVASRLLAGDAAARTAARGFAHALGEFAGDLCLAVRASGGIWLTGGVLDGLGEALDTESLRAGLENKGRMSAMLASTPVYRVVADDLALRGLHYLLSGSISVPAIEARAGSADLQGQSA